MSDAPTSDAPTSDTPTSDTPTSDAPTSDAAGSGKGVAPVGRQADARGVRVSLASPEAEDPEPLVIEPAPMPLQPVAPAAGAGLLGGLATQPGDERTVPAGADQRPTIDGDPVHASLDRLDAERAVLREAPDGDAHRVLLLAPEPSPAAAASGISRREIVIDGWRVEVEVEPAARAALRARARRGREEAGRSGPTEVHAIIPGVVVSVSVAPGDAVVAGQQLLVVEAMKMQNELRAPREGTIERVAVGAGATIEVGDLLLVIA